MKPTIFLEPLAEGQQTTESYEGVSLEHLRKLVLEVAGVEKIYPRTPYLIQAAKASYSQITGLPDGGPSADEDISPDQEHIPTLTVRLGVNPRFRAPEVARSVGQVLATELPGKPISVEVVSC